MFSLISYHSHTCLNWTSVTGTGRTHVRATHTYPSHTGRTHVRATHAQKPMISKLLNPVVLTLLKCTCLSWTIVIDTGRTHVRATRTRQFWTPINHQGRTHVRATHTCKHSTSKVITHAMCQNFLSKHKLFSDTTVYGLSTLKEGNGWLILLINLSLRHVNGEGQCIEMEWAGGGLNDETGGFEVESGAMQRIKLHATGGREAEMEGNAMDCEDRV